MLTGTVSFRVSLSSTDFTVDVTFAVDCRWLPLIETVLQRTGASGESRIPNAASILSASTSLVKCSASKGLV